MKKILKEEYKKIQEARGVIEDEDFIKFFNGISRVVEMVKNEFVNNKTFMTSFKSLESKISGENKTILFYRDNDGQVRILNTVDINGEKIDLSSLIIESELKKNQSGCFTIFKVDKSLLGKELVVVIGVGYNVSCFYNPSFIPDLNMIFLPLSYDSVNKKFSDYKGSLQHELTHFWQHTEYNIIGNDYKTYGAFDGNGIAFFKFLRYSIYNTEKLETSAFVNGIYQTVQDEIGFENIIKLYNDNNSKEYLNYFKNISEAETFIKQQDEFVKMTDKIKNIKYYEQSNEYFNNDEFNQALKKAKLPSLTSIKNYEDYKKFIDKIYKKINYNFKITYKKMLRTFIYTIEKIATQNTNK